jgi:outer membrane protein OmpA-like peptidoglycan-associated protein
MLSAVATAVVGCSGLPDRVDSLEQARSEVQNVERQPLAGRVAGTELAAAHDALAAADRAYEDKESLTYIEHQAYVAQRYADIAGERIAEASAREEVERAEAERNRIIADARSRQAAAAERELQTQLAAAQEQARSVEEAEERNRQLASELEELQAKSTDRGIVLTLGDVLFDTGAATLKPGAATTMDRLAQFMRDYPERSVRIEGHTDSVGSEESNQALSERRADAVRSALVDRNTPPDRITTVGYGEGRPIASNDTSGGRQQNRRVEIVVSNDGGAFAGDGGSTGSASR